MDFETLFAQPGGRTPRAQFLPALATLLAVLAFYAFLVTGRTAEFCMLVLLYPAFVLHARRLHDMGHGAWILIVPTLLLIVTSAIRLKYLHLGAPLDTAIPLAALLVSAALVLYCSVASTREALAAV